MEIDCINEDFSFIETLALEQAKEAPRQTERRAIIDVGSGGTKYLIADFNLATEEYTIVDQGKFNVSYQRALNESRDHLFHLDIREEGIRVFQQIQTLFREHGVEKSFAFATEAFRQAENASEFVAEIANRSGIEVHIFEQIDEASLAFEQAVLHLQVPKEDLVVLEIGTGSFQLTIEGKRSHMGNLGSVPFNQQILEDILGDEEGNMIPLTDEQIKLAGKIARDIARPADSDIKQVIRNGADRTVVGIGNIFTRSLAPHARNFDVVTRKDLRHFIQAILAMPQEDIEKDPFLETDLTNALLVLNFMKALQIREINVLDTSNTTTILRTEDYWS